jgi:hypothetical protein
MNSISDFKQITQLISPSAEDEFFAELEANIEPEPSKAGRCVVTTNYHFQNGVTITKVETVISTRGFDHTLNILMLNKKGN